MARRRAGKMLRRTALLLPLLLAACSGDDLAQRTEFPALHYDYLTPLRLNVATVDVPDAPPPGPLDAVNPAPPGQTLRRMALDRIGAGGATGRAVFVVDQASITQAGDGLSGVMAVHLDVLRPDGGRAAYAEARVTRQATLPRRAELPAALYDMTRAMMDDMNVELEFQARRSLHDWLQSAEAAPAPAPVQQQDLSAPGQPAAPPSRPEPSPEQPTRAPSS
jgi:hypothetical protein